MRMHDSEAPLYRADPTARMRRSFPVPRFLYSHGRVHDQREGERCHPRLRNGGTGISVADGQAPNAPGN
jgi:hypothetical protein